MLLHIIKIIILIIAFMSSLLFISDLISDLVSQPSFNDGKDGMNYKHAAIRLILSLIMSVCWSLFIML